MCEVSVCASNTHRASSKQRNTIPLRHHHSCSRERISSLGLNEATDTTHLRVRAGESIGVANSTSSVNESSILWRNYSAVSWYSWSCEKTRVPIEIYPLLETCIYTFIFTAHIIISKAITSYPSLNVYYMHTIATMKERTGVLLQSCSLICQFGWLNIHHGHILSTLTVKW